MSNKKSAVSGRFYKILDLFLGMNFFGYSVSWKNSSILLFWNCKV